MPSGCHEVGCKVEQIAGCGEVMSSRRVSGECVQGHDLDVGCVVAARLLEYGSKPGGPEASSSSLSDEFALLWAAQITNRFLPRGRRTCSGEESAR